MNYPALDVTGVAGELALAVADDYSPSAAEGDGESITIFFREHAARDGAAEAIARSFPGARLTSREVDDGDWARRSQQNLLPVTVGRLRISPGPETPASSVPPSPASTPAGVGATSLRIVIQPSTGFGTGHHATTRLCLGALQTIDLQDAVVLDVGTGSGVLPLAAQRLGARRAVGIDHDPDAIAAARENLGLNPGVSDVAFEIADLRTSVRLMPDTAGETAADVVTANLTGAVLVREAARLLRAVKPGGCLIVSGLLEDERDAVVKAFAPSVLCWEGREDEWVGLMFTAPNVLPGSAV